MKYLLACNIYGVFQGMILFAINLSGFSLFSAILNAFAVSVITRSFYE